ncbi:hypothetical protein MPTK1_2g25650 [Marchantia polymorpha subsp. ruderalis]|uniref:Uncharacterized protein n=1 Tax=Marchantia polymorpha TaxID=3197 RepID=A0A2R6XBD8_MARPO|nr:hypothetical protein MARPO_0025s0113 [Marchantia polymorpha]BBN03701.1 hypothetical protein Mp_2g25650 [Marchantia polymorpha subsp. ruderalis]|eukprot:PTQ43431.1 hypothetical protein MARPO_0025s0113 [Marchantia polymorpha]
MYMSTHCAGIFRRSLLGTAASSQLQWTGIESARADFPWVASPQLTAEFRRARLCCAVWRGGHFTPEQFGRTREPAECKDGKRRWCKGR